MSSTRRGAAHIVAGERCWKCNVVKQGVRLRACDDRLCEQCYEDNEKHLAVIRAERQQTGVNSPGATALKQPSVHRTPTSIPQPMIQTRSSTAAAATSSPSTTRQPTSTDRPCGRCALPAADTKSCVECDVCQQRYHQQCTNITKKVFDKLLVIIKTTGWVCDSCKIIAKSAASKTQVAIAKLTEEMAVMKQTIADLQPSITVNSASIPSNNNNSDHAVQTAMIVHRTLYDANKRKQNVVVSGLVESDNDRETFLGLCEDHLDIKPHVGDNDCVRIGPVRPDKPRLLLVRLRSETTASAILRSARQLRHSSDPDVAGRVFINPDLSREAAKVAYERRRQRRARQTAASAVVASVADSAVPVNHPAVVNDVGGPASNANTDHDVTAVNPLSATTASTSTAACTSVSASSSSSVAPQSVNTPTEGRPSS